MRIYDYITAAQVDEADLVVINNDPIEVQRTVDETDTIMLEGYSHMSGDNVSYFLAFDAEVGLWTED